MTGTQSYFVACSRSWFGVFLSPFALCITVPNSIGCSNCAAKAAANWGESQASHFVGVRPYGDQYVERVLSFFAGVYRRPAKHVDDVVSAVGLTPVRAQRIRSLSKGFARRLMWALEYQFEFFL